jgi:DNA (cytosine-5)-methyltransferase 1
VNARIVSLFSGYGGLDMGVQSVIGGEVVAHVEFDAAPSRVLAHHWPDVPNLGDITAVDWSQLGDIDVLTGGFPCQDVSLAGLRRGLKVGTRSGLWSEFARAIDALRPGLVVIENVRGLLSAEANRNMESSPWGVGDRPDGPALRALGAVLGDLADLGYDAEWFGLRAADAGAPHERFRIFVFAYPHDGGRDRRERYTGRRSLGRVAVAGGGKEVDADSERFGGERRRDAGDVERSSFEGQGTFWGSERDASVDRDAIDWQEYTEAVAIWEAVIGLRAPMPCTDRAANGAWLISPLFEEWMMGLRPGHVTDPVIWDGVKPKRARKMQLKILGNGVVPQQAALATMRFLQARAVAA